MLSFNGQTSSDPKAVRATLREQPDVPIFKHSALMHLESSRFTIGRAKGNPVVIADPAVSLEHAMLLVPRQGAIEIEDLKSQNGTFVNGLRVQKWQLRDGDCLSFGCVPDEARVRVWIYHGHLTKEPFNPRAAVATHPYNVSPSRLSGDYWIEYQRAKRPDSFSANIALPRVANLSIGRAIARELAITAAVAKTVPQSIHVYRHVRASGEVIELVCPNHGIQAARALDACKRELEGLRELERDLTTPSVMIALATRQPVAQAQPREEEAVVRICHISDLHAGAPDVGWRRDHARVHAAMLRSLKENRGSATPPPLICVTGDLAYSGKRPEYRLVRSMLDELAAAAGVNSRRVRCVPGNHDVDLDLVAELPTLDSLHRSMRSDKLFGDRVMANSESRSTALRKLAAYDELLASLPDHPRTLDWRESLGSGIALLGLATVWASDRTDEEGTQSEGGNLIITKHQLDELVPPASADSLHIVMSHHPMHWLSRWSQDELRRALAGVPAIHLCGHEHEATAILMAQLGARANLLTLSAGAAHRGQNERGPHAYHEIIIKHSRSETRIGYSPRVYVSEANEFRTDRNRCPNVDASGYMWSTLRGASASPAG